MPTLGLSNTVALHAMTNPEKQFPLVRVWGTIGWIVAGFAVGTLTQRLVTTAPEGTTMQTAQAAAPYFFSVAGASGILLGLVSFFLPHTPPPAKGKPADIGSILGFDAIGLMKDRSFAVFIVCSLLICIPLAAYYSFAATYAGSAGIGNVPVTMTFGQMSEIVFMLVMPLFFARFGVKWMLAVGMLAWVLRYVLFSQAWGGPAPGTEHVKWMVLSGIILHGICYDFFFVTGQIYTDRVAPTHVRAQAQGFLVLVTQGIGMLIGNQVFGRLVGAFTDDATKAVDWRTVWLLPAGFAFVVMLVFVAFFKNQRT
jgi:nucleoside transporter